VDLEGLVVDAHGHPVPGATVWLDEESRTTTDAHGRFGFADQDPGRYRLRARKDDLASDTAIATLYEGRGAVVVTMSLGITMHVRVRSGGVPLAGARVCDELEALAISDADGLAVVRGVGSHFQYYTVEADGFAPSTLSMWLADDPGGTIDRSVELVPGAQLGGVVVDPEGAPVANARVSVTGEAWSGDAVSDHEGAWCLAAAAADTYAITASTPLHARSAPLLVETDGVVPRRDLVVRVRCGGRIVATVVDPRRLPVARPVVVAFRTDLEHRDAIEVTGDDHGTVELGGFVPGPYEVYAYAGDRGSPTTRIVLADAEVLSLRLVLEPTAIAGVVVDTRGAPVVGAEVRTAAARVCCDVTDGDGRFRLDGLPPATYDLEVRWPAQRDRGKAIVARHAAGDRDVVLVAPATATIRGRVLFDGTPMPYFGVSLTTCPQFPWIADALGVRSDDGRFELTGITAATWGLVIAGPGTTMHAIAPFEVNPGAELDVGDVHLGPGRRISGHVEDARGVRIAGARVAIGRDACDDRDCDPPQSWFRGNFETTTDADGAFVLDGVSSPPHARLSAFHPERGASMEVECPAIDAPVGLTLVETGTIEGVVFDLAEGHYTVWAYRQPKRADLRTTTVDPSGRFVIEHVRPGDYTIEMIRPFRKPVPPLTTVTVAANERATVRLAMPSED
jgi:hypothetical protein